KAREAAREAERRAAAARARAYAASHSGKVAKALETVKSEMGKPYVWGAAGPDAFDCSGLMQYSFARAGIFLPRTADAQSHAVRSIPSSQLQPGDLIFFGSGHVYHVGMFLRWEGGQAIMLHAPHPGASVREEAAWGSDWHAGTLR
ncbi:MAG: C40 family peptidase, partial [Nocardioides sp.]|nr:C40 family peptidase [Nocardioides sp.]